VEEGKTENRLVVQNQAIPFIPEEPGEVVEKPQRGHPPLNPLPVYVMNVA